MSDWTREKERRDLWRDTILATMMAGSTSSGTAISLANEVLGAYDKRFGPAGVDQQGDRDG